MSEKKDKASLVGIIDSNEDLRQFILRQVENQQLLQDTFSMFKEWLEAFKERNVKIQRECRELLVGMNKKLAKYDSYFIECKKSLKNQEEYLKKNNKLHESVDESLGNMLLAINQNSFLQAWYPKQHGYPEMKVTGRHPAKMTTAKSK